MSNSAANFQLLHRNRFEKLVSGETSSFPPLRAHKESRPAANDRPAFSLSDEKRQY